MKIIKQQDFQACFPAVVGQDLNTAVQIMIYKSLFLLVLSIYCKFMFGLTGLNSQL